MENKELLELLDRLIKLAKETEWVEFKVSNYDPCIIGEAISSLANAALLHDKNQVFECSLENYSLSISKSKCLHRL